MNKYNQLMVIVSFTLCLIFGLGLATFNGSNLADKQWLQLNCILSGFFLLFSCLSLKKKGGKNDDKKHKNG